MKYSVALGLATLVAAAPAPDAAHDLACGYGKAIDADVAIIGGGSSGTYAAVQLKSQGKTAVVVEQQDRLGGHFETYTDPNGIKVDYGVQVLYNNSDVYDFFQHFNVPLAKYQPGPAAVTDYVDFHTGQPLPGFNFSTDLTKYFAVRDKYPAILYGDVMKAPTPVDYTLKFGDLITKYGLQEEAYRIYNTPAAGGLGNILQANAVDVFKGLDQVVQMQALQMQAVQTAAKDYSAVFVRAATELGQQVLYRSTVENAVRSNTGVQLCVRTPKGLQRVAARKLLITMPPTPANMAPFHPDRREAGLFAQLRSFGFYTGLIKQTGLPTNTSFQNAGFATQYHIPQFPGVYHYLPTASPGLYSWWYASDNEVPEKQVRAEVISTCKRLAGANASSNPQIVAYAAHTPYNLHPSAAAVQDGFWAKIADLQGVHSTYYTGGTIVYASAPIWTYTKTLLANMGL